MINMIAQISLSSKIYNSIFSAIETIDEYEDILDWITDIIKNPNRPKRNECEICKSDEKLEQHHVRGNKHGNETITVCHECHETLTENQRLWDRAWYDIEAENKDAFFIRGLIDICVLKYIKFLERELIDICKLKNEKTGQEIFKQIAKKLTRGFSYE